MFFQKKDFLFLIILFFFGFSTAVFGFVSGSSNYRLQSDSVNVGGGLATSTNYRMESTTGEVSTGSAESTIYQANAGYQQMQETYLSINPPENISLPALSLVELYAVGSTTLTIITDNAAGYSATVHANTSDACLDRDGQGAVDALCDVDTGESFADIPIEKHIWNMLGDDYVFGWSVIGDDVTGHGVDTDCMNSNTYNVPSNSLMWQGFNASTAYQIASSTSRTSVAKTDTTLCVATDQEAVYAPSGTYYATTTVTAIAL